MCVYEQCSFYPPCRSSRAENEDAVSQYQSKYGLPGIVYPCWYNPQRPSTVSTGVGTTLRDDYPCWYNPQRSRTLSTRPGTTLRDQAQCLLVLVQPSEMSTGAGTTIRDVYWRWYNPQRCLLVLVQPSETKPSHPTSSLSSSSRHQRRRGLRRCHPSVRNTAGLRRATPKILQERLNDSLQTIAGVINSHIIS